MKKEERKYIVYKNDLKFKDQRNLNPQKIEWNNDNLESIYYNQNLDTIHYRLEECEKNNFDYLDLSHLYLKEIPLLSSKITKPIKYLFLNNNNLSNLKNIEQFTNLQVLDISNNSITTVDYLPKTINELCCKYNFIDKITSCRNLKILDCTNNKLVQLEEFMNLEILFCSENNLNILPYYPKLKKLVCKNNNLREINSFTELVYLDCSFNNITQIRYCPKLKDLLCRDNKLTGIPNNMNSLKYIEMYNNKFTEIYYYPNLKELYCDIDGIEKVPVEYKDKILDTKVYRDKYLIIIFK